MTAPDTLAPCPFCGGPAEMQIDRTRNLFGIGCSKCLCATPHNFNNLPSAIAAWNQRTAAPADVAGVARIAELEGEVERMREALEFYAAPEAWNQPPVKTVPHELLGIAYENQSSKVRNDRGRIARAALAQETNDG